jgi:hypothetical protein
MILYVALRTVLRIELNGSECVLRFLCTFDHFVFLCFGMVWWFSKEQ